MVPASHAHLDSMPNNSHVIHVSQIVCAVTMQSNASLAIPITLAHPVRSVQQATSLSVA